MIFLFVFFFAIVCAFIEDNHGENYLTDENKVPFSTLLLAVILLILCALRDVSVGEDTFSYVYSFENGGDFRELGASILRDFVNYLHGGPQLFIVSFAFLTIFPLYAFFKRESCNVAFSLLIYMSFSSYFYPEAYNTIRATVSVSFFLLGISKFKIKDYKWGVAFILVSVLFHNSAYVTVAIALLCAFIKEFRANITNILLVLSIVFGLTFTIGMSDYATMLSVWLADIMNSDLGDYYSIYGSRLEESSYNIVGLLSQMLPFTIFCLLFNTEENRKNIYYKLFVVGTIMTNVFISVTLTYRITMFLTILITILLPNCLRTSNSSRKFILYTSTVFMLLWFVYRICFTEDTMAGMIPYKFCF